MMFPWKKTPRRIQDPGLLENSARFADGGIQKSAKHSSKRNGALIVWQGTFALNILSGLKCRSDAPTMTIRQL
jgi:hypothetical protein